MGVATAFAMFDLDASGVARHTFVTFQRTLAVKGLLCQASTLLCTNSTTPCRDR